MNMNIKDPARIMHMRSSIASTKFPLVFPPLFGSNLSTADESSSSSLMFHNDTSMGENCSSTALTPAIERDLLTQFEGLSNLSTESSTLQLASASPIDTHSQPNTCNELLIDDRNEAATQDEVSSPTSQPADSSSPPRGVPLPDVTNRPDPNKTLARRIKTYESFIAPPARMKLLPEINESLFDSENREIHLSYVVKTIATIKCDFCMLKCKRGSEVYQCRECVTQMCRECVEEKLGKEISAKANADSDSSEGQDGETGYEWTWSNPKHDAFKIAYLNRKAKASTIGGFGSGEWIGDVNIPGRDDPVHVKIKVAVRAKAGSKAGKKRSQDKSNTEDVDEDTNDETSSKKKRKSKPAEKTTRTIDLEIQRRQVEDQSVSSNARRKLDRIRSLAGEVAASQSVPGSQSSTKTMTNLTFSRARDACELSNERGSQKLQTTVTRPVSCTISDKSMDWTQPARPITSTRTPSILSGRSQIQKNQEQKQSIQPETFGEQTPQSVFPFDNSQSLITHSRSHFESQPGKDIAGTEPRVANTASLCRPTRERERDIERGERPPNPDGFHEIIDLDSEAESHSTGVDGREIDQTLKQDCILAIKDDGDLIEICDLKSCIMSS